MLNFDLANLISEYVDLATYKKLIEIDSKTYTLQKYIKLQIEYEKKFADELKLVHEDEYLILISQHKKLINSSYIDVDEFTNLLNKYITKILEYLNFLELFIIEKKEKTNQTHFLVDAKFEGYSNTKFGDLQFSNTKIEIQLRKYQYLNNPKELHFGILFGNRMLKIKLEDLTPLFKLLMDLYTIHINFY